eukprot:190146-Pelagomonas_calceolata.AAC.1
METNSQHCLATKSRPDTLLPSTSYLISSTPQLLNSRNLATDLFNTLIQSQDSAPNKPSESRYINDIIYEEIFKPEHTPSEWD